MSELNYMEEYRGLHKNGKEVVGALQFSYGYDEANEICKKAIIENKKIILKSDINLLDHLEYSFRKV